MVVESVDDVVYERAGVDGLVLLLSLDNEWVAILGALKQLLMAMRVASIYPLT